jgi:hypothetical protein
MARNHRTYLVSVRQHGGPATVEETRTGRKARLRSLSEAPAQIERWLRESAASEPNPSEERR